MPSSDLTTEGGGQRAEQELWQATDRDMSPGEPPRQGQRLHVARPARFHRVHGCCMAVTKHWPNGQGAARILSSLPRRVLGASVVGVDSLPFWLIGSQALRRCRQM